MINFDDLSFEGFDISCYKFILVEVNKNVSLHILNSKNVLEYTILPKLSKAEKDRLYSNKLESNVFSFLGQSYFLSADNCNFDEIMVPYFKLVSSKYIFKKFKKIKIPNDATRKLSFKDYENLDKFIETKVKNKLLEDIKSTDSVCIELISGLPASMIPKEYTILYHNLCTYVLLDTKKAISMANVQNNCLRIKVDKRYKAAIIGYKGENIKRIAKKLNIKIIVDIKK